MSGPFDQNMKAGDPNFCMGSLFIYNSRMILKKCPKTAWKFLFIGGVEFTPPPQGLTLQNIPRVSRVNITLENKAIKVMFYDYILKQYLSTFLLSEKAVEPIPMSNKNTHFQYLIGMFSLHQSLFSELIEHIGC